MPASPWVFASTAKVNESRSVPFEETLARVRAVASRLPISRVVDLTPLDFLKLPVYGAVTPLARDLKVHLGKGESATAARVSAMMEAVERVSAEYVSPDIVDASFEELASSGAIDPLDFDLPTDTAYKPNLPLDWVRGRDLLQDREALIPVDLAITPPKQGVLQDVDTNGVASGNTYLEAVNHAICEIVERDSVSQLQFASSFGDPLDQPPSEAPVDPVSLPARSLEWWRRVEQAGMDLDVFDITTDVRVPTFHAALIDEQYPAAGGGLQFAEFVGLGTHPNPEVAVFRAISEAIQSRAGFIQAARDSYNRERTVPRKTAIAASRSRTRYRYRRPFSETPGFRSADLLAELSFLIERLACAGIRHCVAVDLTRPDWAIPVVRVRIAGLSEYCVNNRRPGARCLRYLL